MHAYGQTKESIAVAMSSTQLLLSCRWYLDVVKQAKLADYGPVRGTMVIRPYGCASGFCFTSTNIMSKC